MTVVTYFVTAAMVIGSADPEMDEAKKAWEQIRDQRPACVRLTLDAEWLNGQNHCVFDFKRHGKSMSFLEQRDENYEGKASKTIQCWVVNDRYAFTAYRVSKDERWILRHFGQVGTEIYRTLEERLRLYETNSTLAGVSMMDAPLWEIVNKTDYRLVKVEGGSDQYQLEFRQKGDEPWRTDAGLRFWPKEGTIVLNRKRDWTVDSAVVKTFEGVETKWYYTYGDEHGGYPIETVHECEGNKQVRRYTPDDLHTSDGDFSLTAFALPEPDETTANLRDGVEASVTPDGTSVTIRISNRSSRSLRVVGNPSLCGSGGCVVPLTGKDLSGLSTLAQGESQTLTFKLQRTPNEPLSCHTVLRLDDAGILRCVKVWIKGEGNGLRTTVEDTALE